MDPITLGIGAVALIAWARARAKAQADAPQVPSAEEIVLQQAAQRKAEEEARAAAAEKAALLGQAGSLLSATKLGPIGIAVAGGLMSGQGLVKAAQTSEGRTNIAASAVLGGTTGMLTLGLAYTPIGTKVTGLVKANVLQPVGSVVKNIFGDSKPVLNAMGWEVGLDMSTVKTVDDPTKKGIVSKPKGGFRGFDAAERGIIAMRRRRGW